jgi:hypothetical protein
MYQKKKKKSDSMPEHATMAQVAEKGIAERENTSWKPKCVESLSGKTQNVDQQNHGTNTIESASQHNRQVSINLQHIREEIPPLEQSLNFTTDHFPFKLF